MPSQFGSIEECIDIALTLVKYGDDSNPKSIGEADRGTSP